MSDQGLAELKRLLHEVRDPLNNISIHAELGKLKLDRGNDLSEIYQLIDIIINECVLCSNRIDELETAFKHNI